MFWVVQNNLYNEANHEKLILTLKKFDIPHHIVKVVPFFNIIVPHDFDSANYRGEMNVSLEPFVDTSNNVMVCGSISLAKIAKERGWVPGSFLNDNFHYKKWHEFFGYNLLNYNAQIGKLNEIMPEWEEFFIRPCEDTKEFSGMVMTKRQLIDSQNGITIEGMNYCQTDPLVMISPLKEIYSEYRFFVVDGKIVTQSQYKMGNKVFASLHVDEYIIEFAQKMVNLWQPARAFVIDIALTPEGLKIVEINNINSAGFYECDVEKFIISIEKMNFK